MIVTLSGANSFGWQQKLDQLTKAFVAEQGELALERLEGEAADYQHLEEALTSLPFLASQKLVVLRSPSKNKSFISHFEQLLTNVPDSTEVIIVEPVLDKRLSYYKFLKSKTAFQDFPELDQTGLTAWLVQTAKARGGSLSPNDGRYLIERLGLHQRSLSNELDKLLLFNKTIDRASIDLLTEPTPQSSVFQLLEAAFNGSAKRTLDLYSEQRAQKIEPPQIIAMLTWQLHILAIIKTAGARTPQQIAQAAKLNPYVVNKSQAIARRLGLQELKILIAELLAIDKKIKRTNVNPDEALQHYLIKLAVK